MHIMYILFSMEQVLMEGSLENTITFFFITLRNIIVVN